MSHPETNPDAETEITAEATTAEEAMDAATPEDGHADESAYTPSDDLGGDTTDN